MKYELKDVSTCKKTVDIEVENEIVVQERDRIEKEFARKAKIPGFRPSKAPRSVIKTRFQKEIEEELKERIVTDHFRKVMEERSLNPLRNPVLDEYVAKEGEPHTFRISFEVAPEIAVEDYKGMTIQDKKVTVEDMEVDKVIESMRESFARLENTSSETPAEGNYVIVELNGTFLDGKKETMKEENLPIVVGSEENLPEFNTQLSGMKRGEMKEFDVEYPQDYFSKNLAGRKIHYTMKLKEIKVKILPEVDDGFAKNVYQTYYAKEKKDVEQKGVETLLELRLFVRDRIEKRKKLEKDAVLKNELLKMLIEKNEFEIPDAMLEDQINLRMEGIVREMFSRGVNPAKSDVNWTEVREKQIEPAKKEVKAKLILNAIAEKEKIEVKDAEINEAIKMEALSHGVAYDEMRKRFAGEDIQALRVQMRRDRALDFLFANANITSEG